MGTSIDFFVDTQEFAVDLDVNEPHLDRVVCIVLSLKRKIISCGNEGKHEIRRENGLLKK